MARHMRVQWSCGLVSLPLLRWPAEEESTRRPYPTRRNISSALDVELDGIWTWFPLFNYCQSNVLGEMFKREQSRDKHRHSVRSKAHTDLVLYSKWFVVCSMAPGELT